jgi:hypothetical protein
LRHPLGVDRLGDGDDVALGEPAQHDLGDGLAVGAPISVRVGSENRLLRPSANPPPGLVLDPPPGHEVVVGLPLEVGVGLDLVDRRSGPGAVDKVHEPVGVEVGDADGLTVPCSFRARMARQEP